MKKHPLDMTPEEYDEYIQGFPETEQRIMMILRESRYIQSWCPPYASGAGDIIETIMDDLRKEWGLPEKDWWWNNGDSSKA